MVELLLADYTRRGFFDGIGIRLPNIVVRPGKPNKAASGFFSSIIREPLNGEEAMLPVDEGVRNWHASPRAAVGVLIHAAGLDGKDLGPRINLTMPGICCTVGEQIAALRRIAGDKVASPHPPRTRPAGAENSRRLARPFRCRASQRPGLQGRSLVRRDHQGAYRRRTGRPDRDVDHGADDGVDNDVFG